MYLVFLDGGSSLCSLLFWFIYLFFVSLLRMFCSVLCQTSEARNRTAARTRNVALDACVEACIDCACSDVGGLASWPHHMSDHDPGCRFARELKPEIYVFRRSSFKGR